MKVSLNIEEKNCYKDAHITLRYLVQDYFTNKVYSVGKSGSPRDVTQGNPLRPSERFDRPDDVTVNAVAEW